MGKIRLKSLNLANFLKNSRFCGKVLWYQDPRNSKIGEKPMHFLGVKEIKKSVRGIRLFKNWRKRDQKGAFLCKIFNKMSNFMKNGSFSGKVLQYQDLWIFLIGVQKYKGKKTQKIDSWCQVFKNLAENAYFGKIQEKNAQFYESTVVAMFWDTRMLELLYFEYFLGVRRPQKWPTLLNFQKN